MRSALIQYLHRRQRRLVEVREASHNRTETIRHFEGPTRPSFANRTTTTDSIFDHRDLQFLTSIALHRAVNHSPVVVNINFSQVIAHCPGIRSHEEYLMINFSAEH